MGFVIVDLEFNNLREIENENPNFYDENPELKDIEVENEIIEIGAIKLDPYMKPLGEIKIFIKPTFIKKLNPMVSRMTNITQDNIDNGVSFAEGIEKLRELVGEDDILCSWAKDDIREIIFNAHYNNYRDLTWIKKYIDLQEYTGNVLGCKKSLGLKSALDRLKIKVNNDALHDALNDAYYTVQVLKNLYNFRVLKRYIVEDIYKMPIISLANIKEMSLQEDKIEGICPKCKKKLSFEEDFIPYNWRFISLCNCSKCNSKYLGEISIKKNLLDEISYKEIYTKLDDIQYIDYSYKIDKLIKS